MADDSSRLISPIVSSDPPQGGSALTHEHIHHYQVLLSENTIVHWCDGCPEIFIIQRQGSDWYYCKCKTDEERTGGK